ncbi:uncharacterized protein [Lepeophtheirus salmonis]|uniref:uncharacterized protein isoform X1 n=2 Tax=Lepeophtheirus salmonis TaxID=72036 RepID=UPI003AF3FB79
MWIKERINKCTSTNQKTQDFLKYDFTSNERNIELDLYEQLPIEKIREKAYMTNNSNFHLKPQSRTRHKFTTLPFLDSSINFDYTESFRPYYSKKKFQKTTTPILIIGQRNNNSSTANYKSKAKLTFTRKSQLTYKKFKKLPEITAPKIASILENKYITTPLTAVTFLPTTLLQPIDLQEKLKIIYQMQNGQEREETHDEKDLDDYYYYYYYDIDQHDITYLKTTISTISQFIPTSITKLPNQKTISKEITSNKNFTILNENYFTFKNEVNNNICLSENGFCEASDKNYPIQTVEQVMLSEGSTFRTKYQDFFLNISRQLRHRKKIFIDNACNVHESILEPGWAKNIEKDWLVVINTHKYHQKIKITHCYHLSTNVSCTKTDSGSCLQEYTRKKLLVIDPNNLEKGIYFSEFDVPENCTCPSKKKNMTDLFIQSGKDVLIEEGIKKNNVSLLNNKTLLYPYDKYVRGKFKTERNTTQTRQDYFENLSSKKINDIMFSGNYLKNFSQRYISTKPSMLNHTVLSTPMTVTMTNFKPNNLEEKKNNLKVLSEFNDTAQNKSNLSHKRYGDQTQLHRLQDKYRSQLLKANNLNLFKNTETIHSIKKYYEDEIIRTQIKSAKNSHDKKTKYIPFKINKTNLSSFLKNENDPTEIRRIIDVYKSNLERKRERKKVYGFIDAKINLLNFNKSEANINDFNVSHIETDTATDQVLKDRRKEKMEIHDSKIYRHKNETDFRISDSEFNTTKVLFTIQKKYAYNTNNKSLYSMNRNSNKKKITRLPFVPTASLHANIEHEFITQINKSAENDLIFNDSDFENDQFFTNSGYLKYEKDLNFITSIFETKASVPEDSIMTIKQPIRHAINAFEELHLSFGEF